jgi:hypothetical protein
VSGYIKAGRRVPRRIVCPRCGNVIDLSGETVFSMAPKRPTSLARARLKAGDTQTQVAADYKVGLHVPPRWFPQFL